MELLAVVGIIILMMALVIPAFNGMKGGGDVTKAAYDLAGTLEQARTYAMANNTYVWVGFYEEDGNTSSTTPTATSGTGRVVISVVASKDGTRYSDTSVNATDPPPFGTEPLTASPARNQVQLVQLNKLVKLEGCHMASLNNPASSSSNKPIRPSTALDYQVSDVLFNKHTTFTTAVTNPTTFTYPITRQGVAQTYQYTFIKIVEFNSQGEASKIVENTYSGVGSQRLLEIAFQPTRGSLIDPRYSGGNSDTAAAAIQIDGQTGRVAIFRL